MAGVKIERYGYRSFHQLPFFFATGLILRPEIIACAKGLELQGAMTHWEPQPR
jgi:hypothetical protein